MLNYYKNNTEVGSEFGVSEGAVRNWIRKTTDKIYNLELIVVRDKERILKTEGNALILQKLSEEGKKYKSLEDREVVIVPKESYKHLTSNQVTSFGTITTSLSSSVLQVLFLLIYTTIYEAKADRVNISIAGYVIFAFNSIGSAIYIIFCWH